MNTIRGALPHLLALVCLASVALSQQPLYAILGDGAGDQLGSSVSCAGDVNDDGYADVIVGAPMDDDAGADSGTARVVSGKDGGVLHTFTGTGAGDAFGTAVSCAGDVDGDGFDDLIVGAPGDDDNGAESGSVRVHSGADGSVLHTFLGDSAGDEFGWSVSGAGDVNRDGHADLIVGAPGDDNNGADSGSARVFSGASGSILHSFDGGAQDRFGWSVSGADVDGDCFSDLIVGAPLDDDSGADSGRVIVLSGANGNLLWAADGAAPGDQFGWSVSGAGLVDGDGDADVIAGAPLADGNGQDAGSASVLSGADGSTIHTFDGDAAGDNLGWSVAGAGDVDADGSADVITGVPLYDGVAADAGEARVWSGADGTRLWTVRGAASGDNLGRSVGGAGDVNGDGYTGLIAGAPGDDTSFGEAGGAQVYDRNPRDTHVLAATHNPSEAGGNFGLGASACGDVNKDGVPDYVIGAPWDASTFGVARVYSGADHSVLYTFTGPAPDVFFCWSCAKCGDLNKDGHDDVLVGSMHADGVAQDTGLLRVYSGKDGTELLNVFGPGHRSHLGSSLGWLGDVNGDNVGDFYGGLGLDNGEVGAAWVISGATGTALREILGNTSGDWFGWGGAAVGDVDGDGAGDFVAGAPQHKLQPQQGTGYAKVISGATGATIYTFNGVAPGDRFGWSANRAGDVNADGVPDIMVGAYQYSPPGQPDAGNVRVYSGADGSILLDIDGQLSGDGFGQGLGPAGDYNGDGYDDIIVGAPGADPSGIIAAGSAFVYSGRDGSLLQRFDGLGILDTTGRSVTGIGDTDGDGYAEVMVPSPLADDSGTDSGTVRVFESQAKTDPGFTRTFGAACAASTGDLPKLGFATRPVTGQVLQTELSSATPSTSASLGFDNVAKNIPLDINGAPGCVLYALPLILVSTATDASGKASLGLPLPNEPVLVGATIYAQWIIVDPPANTLGLVFSDGGCLTLGKP